MKSLFTALCFLMPVLVFAQLGIKLELNRKDFLLYEPIYACVTIKNDSGKALLFGENPKLQGFILFDIRDRNNNRIPQRTDVDLNMTGLFIGPGEIRSVTIPLHRYYKLEHTGTYQVRVYISHNLLDHEYQSASINFLRIHKGIEVWQNTVGIPDLTGKKDSPAKSRTYSIRALDIGGERYFYLVVDDETTVYGVTHIGYQYGQNQFQAQTDMLSRIHLLVPMSHKVSHYLSFSIDGTNLESSYWKKSSSIPTLYRDPASGKVSRIGGTPAIPGVDFKQADRNRYTTTELNKKYMATPTNLLQNTGVVDIGRNVGSER